jgi:hypothetical protein
VNAGARVRWQQQLNNNAQNKKIAAEAAARAAVESAITQRDLVEGAGPTIPRNTSKNETRETMRRRMNWNTESSAKNTATRKRLAAAKKRKRRFFWFI